MNGRPAPPVFIGGKVARLPEGPAPGGKMHLKITILAVVAMLVTAGLWPFEHSVDAAEQAGASGQKTVWDGIYSDTQAASGQALYEQYCTRCHMPNLSGGGSDPPLTGDKFMENWREDNLDSLYRKIKTTMPRNSTRVLTEPETLTAMAYILRENGLPSGSELQEAALGSIRIQLKEGPRPLPNYAQVEVVGCLAQERNAWRLTMVDQPRRVRGAAEKPSPEEVKLAGSIPLGNRSFGLQNFTILGDFQPEPHKGHKMLARGALIRRTGAENISVTAMEMVDERCGS